jgi:predicted DNA binding CopG/RHH family protein
MADIGYAIPERIRGGIASAELRRVGKTHKKVQLTFSLPDQHYLDAIKEEARIRGMSLNHFMRSMVRGYFGAA